MIWVAGIEAARRANAVQGANLAGQIAEFLPAIWPTHRYSEETPDGVFEETTAEVSAPGHPGDTMIVPDWRPIGDPYGFDAAEGNKVGNFNLWLFSRRGLDFCLPYTTLPAERVFIPFGAGGDRSFPGFKFPRAEWKAGSFDEDLYNQGRLAIAENLLQIILQFDRINSENIILVTRDWIIEKVVQGVTVQSMEPDFTFAAVPELMEDIPNYLDEPAYLRVSSVIGPTDASWQASKTSFAIASALYEALMNYLQKGTYAADFFDQCFTVWRTGSQTRRRDSYE